MGFLRSLKDFKNIGRVFILITNLGELETMGLGLKLTSKIDPTIEIDLMAESFWVLVRKGDKDSIISWTEFPLRHEPNGSMLITLQEIAAFIKQETVVTYFTLFYNSALYGGVLRHHNEIIQWTLEGITNGYAS
jgi:hypothetical protein